MERDQLHKEDSQWKKARCQGDSFQGENRELGNFRGFTDLFCVCFLSLLYLLNYNKFGGLQQYGFILFCFWGVRRPISLGSGRDVGKAGSFWRRWRGGPVSSLVATSSVFKERHSGFRVYRHIAIFSDNDSSRIPPTRSVVITRGPSA